MEHLAICVRFVDDNDEIREEFITFLKLERVRADDLANIIIQSLVYHWMVCGGRDMMVHPP